MSGSSPRTLLWLSLVFLAGAAGAGVPRAAEGAVVSLPPAIAETLRAQNSGGRDGCAVSNIFVHGFHFLDTRFDRTLWFLGAPDYLCETNSFLPVIATRDGEWTTGWASEEDGLGNRMLAGVPTLFQHSAEFGHFVIAEWQIAGPMNYLYHSANGKTWISVPLPEVEAMQPAVDSGPDASIRRLCVVETGAVVVVYEELPGVRAGAWSSPVGESFPETVAWTRLAKLPDDAQCDGVWPRDFMPRSLREKTSDGAIFDVFLDWRVRIPGPTK